MENWITDMRQTPALRFIDYYFIINLCFFSVLLLNRNPRSNEVIPKFLCSKRTWLIEFFFDLLRKFVYYECDWLSSFLMPLCQWKAMMIDWIGTLYSVLDTVIDLKFIFELPKHFIDHDCIESWNVVVSFCIKPQCVTIKPWTLPNIQHSKMFKKFSNRIENKKQMLRFIWLSYNLRSKFFNKNNHN